MAANQKSSACLDGKVDDDDDDYFGAEQDENVKKSQSGFAIKAQHNNNKKKKKKKVPKVPSMSAPKIPSFGFGIGLSEMSLRAAKSVKMNKKWKVIERVMVLRGFDLFDQQTIRILIED